MGLASELIQWKIWQVPVSWWKGGDRTLRPQQQREKEMGSRCLLSSWQHWATSHEKAGSDPLKLHVHTTGTETTNWFHFLYLVSERDGSVNGERYVTSSGKPAPTSVCRLRWWAQHREPSYSAPCMIWVDRSLHGDPLCVALPAESLVVQNSLQHIDSVWVTVVQLRMTVEQYWGCILCLLFWNVSFPCFEFASVIVFIATSFCSERKSETDKLQWYSKNNPHR